MDKKGFGKINEILGFEIIDNKSALVSENVEKFKKSIPSLLEQPKGPIKDHIRHLFYILSNLCWTQGIYSSSLQKINISQGTQPSFSDICIPIFDISDLNFQQIHNLFGSIYNESAKKSNLAAFSLNVGNLNEADLLLLLSKVATAALLLEYSGSLFFQANQLNFERSRFESDRENLMEELKSKTKQAIHLGIFNINYDASQLFDMEASRISEIMLMNLKMVAMATNLWVRFFQPNGVVVSVSGNIGECNDSIPGEADVKEFLQRLFKEGSRLRFNVSGEDISKVEIPISEINQITLNQINQLNEFVRREMKLGGVVIDAGTIKDMKAYLPFSGLKICELKIKPEKDLITKDNIETILKNCGAFNVEFDLEDYAMKMNQFPKVAEF